MDWLVPGLIVATAVLWLARRLRREQGCAHCPAKDAAPAACQHSQVARATGQLRLGRTKTNDLKH